MKVIASYFRQKADLFRQLADVLIDQNDHVALQLRCVADEFDANANALETRIARETTQILYDERTLKIH